MHLRNLFRRLCYWWFWSRPGRRWGITYRCGESFNGDWFVFWESWRTGPVSCSVDDYCGRMSYYFNHRYICSD